MAVEDMPFLRGAAAAQTHEGSGNDDESPAPAGPPNFELVWEEYQRRLDAQREWDENGVDIHPDYGFVAKTRDPKSKKKVFFNIVSSPMLSPPIEEPVPGEPSQTRVRIPMSCDGPVQDIDKDGVECEVFDIVFNPETISKSTEDPVFRQFVLEVSLENIRQKLDKELEPKFTFPKMKYKGEGPPRMHHIKKTGILKKPLVELVEDEAEYERAERERDAAAEKQKSDFKLNFDQMYGNQAAKGANGKASSKPALPSVASLLADRQQAQQKHEPQPTPQPQPQSQPQPQPQPQSVSESATSVASSAPITATVAQQTPTNAALKPASTTSAACALVESDWTQANVRCQLQCPSLSVSRANASGLIPFDSAEWDSEVLPESLNLSIHMPSLKRIADLDVDISSDDVLIQRAESCVDAALAIDFTRLRVPLPFAVDDGESSAKFDKRTAVLQFRMPVVGVLSASAAATYAAAVAERREEAGRIVDSASVVKPLAAASPLVDSAALQQQFGELVFSSPLLFRLI